MMLQLNKQINKEKSYLSYANHITVILSYSLLRRHYYLGSSRNQMKVQLVKLLIRPRFLWHWTVNRTGERFFPFFPFVYLKLLFIYLLTNFQRDDECSRKVTEQNPFWNGFFWCLEWSVRRLSALCQGKPCLNSLLLRMFNFEQLLCLLFGQP